jgi:DNA-binding NarL/FixJ family response regulator
MKKIRVILADDHSILRQGVAKVISEYADIEIIGLASNSEELLKLTSEQNPDVVISDIEMPQKNLLEIIGDIKKSNKNIKVLVLSMHDSPEYVLKALESGVSGYITKFTEKEELIKAIRTVHEGNEYFGQKITEVILKGLQNLDVQNTYPLDKLSKRELEILKLLAEGKKSKEIADALFISERTVSNHRANILGKCEVGNTAELLKIFYNKN